MSAPERREQPDKAAGADALMPPPPPPRSVFVPGLPAPQGSKVHLGNGRMIESSKRLKPWRATIVATVQAANLEPLPAAPLCIRLIFVLPRLQSHWRTGRYAGLLKPNAPMWHTSYPDGSKLQRAVEDALVTAGVIPDDRYIAEWTGTKVYGSPVGVHIVIEELQ